MGGGKASPRVQCRGARARPLSAALSPFEFTKQNLKDLLRIPLGHANLIPGLPSGARSKIWRPREAEKVAMFFSRAGGYPFEDLEDFGRIGGRAPAFP